MKHCRCRMVALIPAALLLLAGLVRADLFRFQARENALRESCQKEREKLGITDVNSIKGKYPTPEIGLIRSSCLTPGGTAEVTVEGRFAPNTRFVFESDQLEVVSESLTAGTYRATLKAAAGIGPESASLWAISPVSGIVARKDRAVVVGGRYEWTLKAQNGWRITARTTEDERCRTKDRQGENRYEILFFRGEEKAPFEKRRATLLFSAYGGTPYRFSIDEGDTATGDVSEEMNRLVRKMSDPALSEAERDKATKQMEDLQTRMQAMMAKLTDPSYYRKLEEAKNEFGCSSMELSLKGGAASGALHCSAKVGRSLTISGTASLLSPG